MKKDLLSRLEDKFLVGDQCWLWTGAMKPNGYGTISHEGVTCHAHRVVYELLVGPVPAGLDLDHLCHVRRCVRPDHLEPVTRGENIRRGLCGALKTHCAKGHPWIAENIFVAARGSRGCRICKRQREAISRAKRKALLFIEVRET